MDQQQSVITVVVRYSAGAHTTQTIRGKRASSTSSAEQAARSLGHKLFTDRPFALRMVAQGAGADQTWEITA